jgi:hypothetical protein
MSLTVADPKRNNTIRELASKVSKSAGSVRPALANGLEELGEQDQGIVTGFTLQPFLSGTLQSILSLRYCALPSKELCSR